MPTFDPSRLALVLEASGLREDPSTAMQPLPTPAEVAAGGSLCGGSGGAPAVKLELGSSVETFLGSWTLADSATKSLQLAEHDAYVLGGRDRWGRQPVLLKRGQSWLTAAIPTENATATVS